MGKESILLNCWYRLWNKVSTDNTPFMNHDVSRKFDFIEHILKGKNVDTSKYTHLELIEFIDNITKSVDIAKCDWPLITRIVNCVNMCYYNVDDINTTEDVTNVSKESQKELLKVLRSIFDSSDEIREYMFDTSSYYDILKLDSEEIIAKYNDYTKSTDYKLGDEIYIKANPNEKYWITKIYIWDFDCLSDDGSVRCIPKTDCKKTGRHNVSLDAALQNNMEDCIILEDVNNRE